MIKHYFLFTLSLLFVVNLSAQHVSFEEEWSTALGTDKDDNFLAGVKAADGGVLLVGEITPDRQNKEEFWNREPRNKDGWIIKLDQEGNKVWEYVGGGKADDKLSDIVMTAQGDFVAVGEITLNGEKKGWAVKMSTDGQKIWEFTFEPSISNSFQKVINTRDGGVLIVGALYNVRQGNFDGWAVKLDRNGSKKWEWSGGGPYSDQFRDVVTLNDGSHVLAGVTQMEGQNDLNGWIVRLDANGNPAGEQKLGGNSRDYFAGLTYTRDGGVALIGATTDEATNAINGWLVKMNNQLELSWEKKFDDKNIAQLRAIQPTEDGGYLLVGSKNRKQTAGFDEWVVKLDRRWKRIWDQDFSFTQVDRINDLLALSEIHFLFIGSKVNGRNMHDAWSAKLKVISPRMKIEEYVYKEINKWAQRGEFEKTDVYLNRVNQATRTRKAAQLEDEITTRLKNQLRRDLFSEELKLGKYDPDNESYQIMYQDDEFVIPVKLSEANVFKNAIDEAVLSNVDFILSGEYLRISHFELQHPEFSKPYVWDYTYNYPYEPSPIDYAFRDIEVEKKEKEDYNRGPRARVDVNIPIRNQTKPDAYALIIGNEDYSTYQKGLNAEADVKFAINDAKIFREYCVKTFGIPARNITYLENATLAQMTSALIRLEQLIELSKGKAEVYVYYAGHGFPDEQTKESYLMPVDVSGTDVKIAIKLNDMYDKLVKHPSQRVTVFLDACFSGAGRDAGLLAMRGVKIRPKSHAVKGNMVVFASSSGQESSGPYYDKKHGLFTFFLLEKINTSGGVCSYKELSDYLTNTIPREAVIINNKRQTPQILVGPKASGKWEGWKF